MAAIEQSPWEDSLSDVFPFDLIEYETRMLPTATEMSLQLHTKYLEHTQSFLVTCSLNNSVFLEIMFHIPMKEFIKLIPVHQIS